MNLNPKLPKITKYDKKGYQKKFFINFRSMDKKQKWKFWGPAPVAFRFAENEESYFIGSDVANYMRLFRGKLYNTFPNLTIRKATKDEVRKIPVSFQSY